MLCSGKIIGKVSQMGMASSQARLLHLTGRMHQIEYKAQKLEAQKLQLANDSRRVYEDYLNVLESTKVQFKSINRDGSITFLDATLAALENRTVESYTGVTCGKTFLLQDASTGTIYLTESFANQWGIEGHKSDNTLGTLDEYIKDHINEIPKKVKQIEVPDYQRPKLQNNPVFDKKVSNYNPSAPDGKDWTVSTGDIDVAQEKENTGSYTLSNNIVTPIDVSTCKSSGSIPQIEVSTPTSVNTQIIKPGSIVSNAGSVSGTDETSSGIKTYTTWFDCAHTANIYKEFRFYSDFYNTNTDFWNWTTTLGEVADTYINLGYSDWGTEREDVLENSKIYIYKPALNADGYLDYSDENIIYTYEFSGKENLSLEVVFNDLQEQCDELERITSYYGNIGIKLPGEATLRFEGVGIGDCLLGAGRNCNTDTYSTSCSSSTRLIEYGAEYLEWAYHFYHNGELVNIDYSDFINNSEIDQEDLTYEDYFNWLSESGIFGDEFCYDSDKDELKIGSDWTVEAPYVRFYSNELSYTEDTKTVTTHTINAKDLAKNLYLAECIKNETSVADYNANNSTIENGYVTNINNSSDNYRKRMLVALNDAILNVLSNPSASDYNTNLIYINSIIWQSANDETACNSIVSNLASKNLIDINNYPADDLYIINTTQFHEETLIDGNKPTGTNKGSVTNVAKNADMIEYLAYEMSQKDSSKKYNEYKSQLEGKGYNKYQLANIVYNLQSNKDAVLTALINGDASAYTTEATNWADTTMYEFAQEINDQFSVTENKIIRAQNKEGVLQQIAYDLYSNNSIENPIDFYNNQLLQKYGSLSDQQIASLSRMYGTSGWNSVLQTALTGNAFDSDWLDDYSGYIVEPVLNNNVNINQATSTKYVEMDTENDIATRLAGDIYAKAKTADPDTDMNPETVRDTIKGFGKAALANLSSYYNTADWDNIVIALYNNRNNLNKSCVNSYLNAFDSSITDYRVTGTDNLTITSSDKTKEEKGKVEVPTYDGIASNLLEAFRQVGKIDYTSTLTAEDIKNSLQSKFGNSTDAATLETLANINDIAANYLKNKNYSSDVQNIYEHLINNASLGTISKIWDKDKYDFEMKNLGVCSTQTYNTKFVDDPNGETELDYDSNAYKSLVQKYNIAKSLQGFDIEIIEDSDKRANSYEFVANFANSSLGVFIDFDPKKFNSGDSLKEMSHTNISVETSLQEVSDEKELKKAEAKYESDMRQIDKKDRKYDQDLAALEAERSAIKEEMETLKTVAKENVDRTFRLFS